MLNKRSLAVLFWLCVVASACGSDGPPVAPTQPSPVRPAPPSPPPPPPPAPSGGGQIKVGEEVRGILTAHGQEHVFEVTAPAGGTLVVDVVWDKRQGHIELWFGDKGHGPDGSDGRISVALPVVEGTKYVFSVCDGAPWDYDVLLLRYVLTTSMR